MNPEKIKKHSFAPLIHYIKEYKKYDRSNRKVELKKRHIRYCSHQDAAILSYYATLLSARLEEIYANESLGDVVIAYRKLGKANYHFAKEIFDFVKLRTPCRMTCYDISGFFDSLDHKILRERLKEILSCNELPDDWYKIFRFMAKYRCVDLASLESCPELRSAFAIQLRGAPIPICTIRRVKELGLSIDPNKELFGIPQGTPASSVFSNAYMLGFERKMRSLAASVNGLYRRYSDDIVFISGLSDSGKVDAQIKAEIANVKLEINDTKTDTIVFGANNQKAIQYLGFGFDGEQVFIRPSSLSRQWRKQRRSIAKTERVGLSQIAKGKATKIFTKKLRSRFTTFGGRNFSSYARRLPKCLRLKGLFDK